MKAQLHARRDGYRFYTVADGKKFWSVHHHFLRDHWNIQNGRGREVNEWGRLGLRIIIACETTFRELEQK